MIKRTDTTADWLMKDNKRPTVQNPVTSLLYPNTSGAEATGVNDADFLSNGYKIRTTGTAENAKVEQLYLYGICRKSISRN
jgi:hypothetical protein